MQMKPRLGPIMVRSLIALVVLWAALAVVAVYQTQKARTDAENFLKDSTQLQVGKSTLDEVTPLVNKYHGEWRTYERTYCGPGTRTIEFVFDNRWLHRLFLAPLTQFGVDIYIKNSHVCARSMGLIAVTKAPFGVSVDEYPEAQEPRPFHAQLNPFKTLITLTTSASPAQRTAAYSVNLDCLTKLTGCQDAREMAPAIWKNSREVEPTYWKSQWDD